MKNKWIKLSSVLVLGVYLAACGNTSEEETADNSAEVVDETSQEEDHSHDEHDHEDEEDHAHDEEDHAHDEEEGHASDHEAPETVEIEGVQDHYHTGGLIELTAVLDEEVDSDHWHWYVRENENAEWEVVEGQGTEEFVYEAPEESFEVRAVLFGEDHEAYVQSPPIEIEVDNH